MRLYKHKNEHLGKTTRKQRPSIVGFMDINLYIRASIDMWQCFVTKEADNKTHINVAL